MHDVVSEPCMSLEVVLCLLLVASLWHSVFAMVTTTYYSYASLYNIKTGSPYLYNIIILFGRSV